MCCCLTRRDAIYRPHITSRIPYNRENMWLARCTVLAPFEDAGTHMLKRRPGAEGSNPLAVYFEDVASIASMIRGRSPGSADERRAAEYVAERLQEFRIPSTTLPFQTPRSWIPPYIAIFSLAALSIPLTRLSAIAGLVVSLAAVVLLVIAFTSWTRITRLMAKVESQNVVGLIPARPAKQEGSPASMRRIVLSAHLDTANSGWLWKPSLVRWFRPLALLVFAAVVILPILQLIGLFAAGSILWVVSIIPFVILLAAIILLAETLLRGVPVAGANSDASGIAVVLAAAEVLRKERPAHLETWILFTGAEEAGMVGMSAFLEENQFDPDTTYFINVDSVGAGFVRYTFEQGLVLPRRSSPILVRIAGSIARSEPKWHVQPVVQPLIPADQIVALARGYQAISITARDGEGQIPHWHQPSDTTDQIDAKTMETAANFVLAMIRRLDTEAISGTIQRGSSPISLGE